VLPWVVTGAFAAGGVAAGLLTWRANNTQKDLHDSYPVTRSELDAAHARTQNLLMTTMALGGATVVSLGYAIYSTFIRRPAPEEKRVGLAVGPTGIAVHGWLP
jgi:hypothetical protein